jgi:hypothetical protein
MIPHGNLDTLVNITNKIDGMRSQGIHGLLGSSSESEGLCVRNELREEGLVIGRSRALLKGQRDESCITGF